MGETSGAAAALEALEEAGVKRIVSRNVFGSFVYTKDSSNIAYHIDVHLLEVRETLRDFAEKEVRRLQWHRWKRRPTKSRIPSFAISFFALPAACRIFSLR